MKMIVFLLLVGIVTYGPMHSKHGGVGQWLGSWTVKQAARVQFPARATFILHLFLFLVFPEFPIKTLVLRF